MDSTVENYRILVTKESPDEKVIFRDIHRTFPAHEFFKVRISCWLTSSDLIDISRSLEGLVRRRSIGSVKLTLSTTRRSDTVRARASS